MLSTDGTLPRVQDTIDEHFRARETLRRTRRSAESTEGVSYTKFRFLYRDALWIARQIGFPLGGLVWQRRDSDSSDSDDGLCRCPCHSTGSQSQFHRTPPLSPTLERHNDFDSLSSDVASNVLSPKDGVSVRSCRELCRSHAHADPLEDMLDLAVKLVVVGDDCGENSRGKTELLWSYVNNSSPDVVCEGNVCGPRPSERRC
jgi:hypothetical protein